MHLCALIGPRVALDGIVKEAVLASTKMEDDLLARAAFEAGGPGTLTYMHSRRGHQVPEQVLQFLSPRDIKDQAAETDAENFTVQSSALYDAAACGGLPFLKAVVELEGQDGIVKDLDGNHGSCLAHVAAIYGRTQCLELLGRICEGKMFHIRDKNKKLPAHFAAEHGHIECLKVIAEIALETFRSKDNKNMLPMEHAIINNHLHCCQYILQLWIVRPESGSVTYLANVLESTLRACAKHDNLQCAQLALKYPIVIKMFKDQTQDLGRICVQQAANSGSLDMFKLSLQHASQGVLFAKDVKGRTAAYYAARQGHGDILQHMIAVQGHEAVMKLLLDKGHDGSCAVAYVAAHGMINILQDVFGKKKREPHFWQEYMEQTEAGSAAHVACSLGNIPGIKILHKMAGAELFRIPDERGRLPVFYAPLHSGAGLQVKT